ncbi:uncharacterized protein LOC110707384 [Chenopodium quinoa]|uniref:uncharacterized protein LOC110707384 n=1 Tax=Chenopodium quinoa TaxID=63459 RepID=UPI000B78A6A9|nr:uncharacterized protein LOC110707384 [Chenopodium quinoa]
MSGFERPVLKLKGMQHSSSESSLHLKVDESPQSSVSEERKITSEPYQCNGSRQRESNKEESKEDDKKPQGCIILLQAGVALLDEPLIEERRPNQGIMWQMEPNVIQDTQCEKLRWVDQSNPMEDLQYHVLEKETRICELEYELQCRDDKIKILQLKKDNLEEDVQEMKNEVYAMWVEMMKCSRNKNNISMALVFSWIFFAVVLFYLKF